MSISTHVLDTSLGLPASGIPVRLEQSVGGSWKELSLHTTNADGRVSELIPSGGKMGTGEYRITFELKKYFSDQKRKSFYPVATIVFEIENSQQHFHVPLLLSGFGFSTYRGS